MKLKKNKRKLDELRQNIVSSFSLLGYYKTAIQNFEINCDNIHNIITQKQLSTFKQTLSNSSLSSKYWNNINNIITNIINLKTLVEKIEEENEYLELIANIPYKIFTYIINSFNKYLIREVLLGKSMTLGSETRQFQIFLFNRKFGSIPIDWKESMELLKSIAKNQEKEGLHSLYSLYTNKKIKKKEFIDRMKEFTYNKENNSNGKKWIVYRTESQFPVIKWHSNAMSKLNSNLYTFRPTNFINTKTRSQIDFANNAKSEDEIIDSNLLGFRDKLNVLLRFNPNAKLRYDDLQFSE